MISSSIASSTMPTPWLLATRSALLLSLLVLLLTVALPLLPQCCSALPTTTTPFSLVAVTHVPHPIVGEQRGFHYVQLGSSPDPVAHQRRTHRTAVVEPLMLWGCGILGELVGWDVSDPSVFSPPVYVNVRNGSLPLTQARTILAPPFLHPRIVIGAEQFLVVDISNTSSPQMVQQFTTPASHQHHGDNGINGLISLTVDQQHIIVGAVMPGYLSLLLYNETADALQEGGAVSLSALGSVSRCYDVDWFVPSSSGGNNTYLATISGSDSHGVLAILRISDDTGKLWPSNKWSVVSTLQKEWSGCNRVRVIDHTNTVVFSCFGAGADNVVFVDVSQPEEPHVIKVVPFVSQQPTGILLAGHALVVAGGRDFMVFNVSDPQASSVVATCGDACSKVMLSGGQNAHGLAHHRYSNDHGNGISMDKHLIYLTAQIDNNVGSVTTTDPDLIALFEAS